MKPYSLLTILLLLIGLGAHCQTTETDTGRVYEYRKWTWGVSVSPAYSYRKLKPFVYEDQYAQQILGTRVDSLVDSLNLLERGKLALTVGLDLTYRFNKRLSLRMGLSISDKGIAQSGFLYYDGYSRSWRTLDQGAISKTRFLYWEQFWALQYDFFSNKSGKFDLSVWAGSTIAFNAEDHDYSSRRELYFPDPIDKAQPFFVPSGALFHMGFIAGLGITADVNKRIAIGAEPVLTYYLKSWFSQYFIYDISYYPSPIYTLDMIETPYSIGCNFTFRYSFGKLIVD